MWRGETISIRIRKNYDLKVGGLRSKAWDEFSIDNEAAIAFVFTLWDHAAPEICPVWPGNPVTGHWGMPDPSTNTGTASNKLAALANTCSLLHHYIGKFLDLPKPHLDAKSVRYQVK